MKRREVAISFTGPMLRRLRAGQKTQTRRLVKAQPVVLEDARYRKGDLLWVQENHTITGASDDGSVQVRYADGTECGVRFTEAEFGLFKARTKPYTPKPARFMYRSLSRDTLTVTEVRLERVLEISHADAEAEGALMRDWGDGIERWKMDWQDNDPATFDGHATARDAFHAYFEQLHPGVLVTDPFVLVVQFCRERA